MVTKLCNYFIEQGIGLILAKIHMVTKRNIWAPKSAIGLILAKIHMVTKLVAPSKIIQPVLF